MTDAQKVLNKVEVPEMQILDKVVVDAPVARKTQAPMIQKAPKVVERPEVPSIDRLVDKPVTKNIKVPMIQRIP